MSANFAVSLFIRGLLDAKKALFTLLVCIVSIRSCWFAVEAE